MRTLLRVVGVVIVLVACFVGGQFLGPLAQEARMRLFPEPEYRTGDFSSLYAETKQRVVVFSTSTCPFCERTRKLLADEGVAYSDFIVDKSADAQKRFVDRGGGAVPLIYIGDREIRGFRESAIRDALHAIGVDRPR